jgi:AraC-like DNA-binding protein
MAFVVISSPPQLLYRVKREIFLAKIAVESGPILLRRALARGNGWSVSDVICGAGPYDRPFEEQHSHYCIAVVMEGSFQYQSRGGRELMTPGSLLLGNAGQHFECGHEHGVGDRCISFAYETEYFEDLATEMDSPYFSMLRVPPIRDLSGLVARVCAGLIGSSSHRTPEGEQPWKEVGVELVGRALENASKGTPSLRNFAAAESRVTRIVRLIDTHPNSDHGLESLAREAKLSRYHFLRVFQQLTGLTPYQYLRRTRLRRAAGRLIAESAPVLDIALDSGFGDVSNFNHAFRAEFGLSPRSYRKHHAHFH